jgi:hypothetical protein
MGVNGSNPRCLPSSSGPKTSPSNQLALDSFSTAPQAWHGARSAPRVFIKNTNKVFEKNRVLKGDMDSKDYALWCQLFTPIRLIRSIRTRWVNVYATVRRATEPVPPGIRYR